MTKVEWPWQYSFPPFFTIQPNLETRAKQLEAWKTLVLDYHKASQQAILDISEAERSPLFNNTSIKLIIWELSYSTTSSLSVKAQFNDVEENIKIYQYRLPSEGIILILESLAKKGNAEPCDKSKTRWYIYWHTLGEWADIVYSWAQETGQVNSVCTFYEIINASDQEFTGLNQDVLIKALKVLESQRKAEVIVDDDDAAGVKFF